MNLDLGDTRLIMAEAKRYGCLRNQLAYILATARWETAQTMKPVKEAYWLSEKWRAENLRYYPWFGRGFVQITWQRNYIKAGQELDLDLTSNPDVVLEPEIAAKILVAGSMEGWFTGKSIPDYITLQRSDYVGARRVINGTDKAQTIARLAERYDAALQAEGYGEEPAAPPATEIPSKPSLWAAIVAALQSIFGRK